MLCYSAGEYRSFGWPNFPHVKFPKKTHWTAMTATGITPCFYIPCPIFHLLMSLFIGYSLLKSRLRPPFPCYHQLMNRTPLILLNSSCDTVLLGKKKGTTGFKLSSVLVPDVEQDGMWQTDRSVTTQEMPSSVVKVLCWMGTHINAGLPEGIPKLRSANPRTTKRLNYGWCLAKLIFAVCFILTPYLIFKISNILHALCIAK